MRNVKKYENITITKRKYKDRYVWMRDVMKLTCRGIEIEVIISSKKK